MTWTFQVESSCNYNIKLNLKYLFFSVVFLYIVQTALSLVSIFYLVCLAKLSVMQSIYHEMIKQIYKMVRSWKVEGVA